MITFLDSTFKIFYEIRINLFIYVKIVHFFITVISNWWLWKTALGITHYSLRNKKITIHIHWCVYWMKIYTRYILVQNLTKIDFKQTSFFLFYCKNCSVVCTVFIKYKYTCHAKNKLRKHCKQDKNYSF